jgi:uncharacterized protein involved in exopolysaccharide biosynthesis
MNPSNGPDRAAIVHEQAPDPNATPPGMSIVEAINVVLQHRGWIIGVPLVLFAVVVTLTLLKPRTYTSSAAFVAQGPESGTSNLGGLAAQFGVSIPTGARSQSPEFYAELLRSRAILAPAAETQYTVQRNGRMVSGTLVDHFEIDQANAGLARAEALEELADAMSVSTGRQTGIVRFSVRTKSPELSERIARRVMALLETFDLEMRQTLAQAERAFIESRTQDAARELRAVENQLETFLDHNRAGLSRSPHLLFQHERLVREVGTRQQLHSELLGAFEKARIDEVRNTPVLTVLEAPEAAVKPDRRGLMMRAILALFMGGLLGVFIAFTLAFTGRDMARYPEHMTRFRELKRRALGPLARPGRSHRSSVAQS